MKPFELGEKIKLLRKEKNLTQQELANKAGISRQTLSHLENGKIGTVSIRVLIVILNELGYELDIKPKNQILPPLGEEMEL